MNVKNDLLKCNFSKSGNAIESGTSCRANCVIVFENDSVKLQGI